MFFTRFGFIMLTIEERAFIARGLSKIGELTDAINSLTKELKKYNENADRNSSTSN